MSSRIPSYSMGRVVKLGQKIVHALHLGSDRVDGNSDVRRFSLARIDHVQPPELDGD